MESVIAINAILKKKYRNFTNILEGETAFILGVNLVAQKLEKSHKKNDI